MKTCSRCLRSVQTYAEFESDTGLEVLCKSCCDNEYGYPSDYGDIGDTRISTPAQEIERHTIEHCDYLTACDLLGQVLENVRWINYSLDPDLIQMIQDFLDAAGD